MHQILMQNQILAENLAGSFMSNPAGGAGYVSTGTAGTASVGTRQSHKQAKVQSMKTQQLLHLQQ